MPFRNLTILKKGLLVLLLPLIYQVLLLGMLLKRQRDQVESEQWVVHTKDILAQVGRVERSALRLQTAFRGFVLTGEPSFEAEARQRLPELPALLRTLEALTETSPAAQRAHVAKIGELVGREMDYYQSQLQAMSAGQWPSDRARLAPVQGKQLMDALSAEVASFENLAAQLDAQRLARLQGSTRLQNRLLLGGLILNVALGVAATLFFVRNIGRRVDLLAANARRFSRGEELLPVGTGSDELAQLDVSFRAIASSLAEARAAERAAHEVLERRAQELERVNRELDHKNEENEMFVYSVSHDLRSPLVNLQGFSKELGLVRDDLRTLFGQEWTPEVRASAEKLVDREVSESIHYIQTAVLRLSAIIDALLRLSRAGRVDYEPAMVELAAVVQRIATALRGTLAERGAELVIRELPAVWGDPTALEQIFANLLTNAVHYLDPARPGRIEVGACPEPPRRAAGLTTFYVKDNGLGIPAAYLPKVFGVFQRLHPQAAKGEGIGLTLVRRMVERHGGTIWVESEAGVGSTFYVALPERAQSPLVGAPRRDSIKAAHPEEFPV